MKRSTIFIILCVLIFDSCKKEFVTIKPGAQITWCRIRNSNSYIIDSSNYLNYPDTLTRRVVLIAEPRTNRYKDWTNGIVGDTVDFKGYNTANDYDVKLDGYHGNLKGILVTQSKIRLLPIQTGNRMLVRGTLELFVDDSVELEATDSIIDGTGRFNHYIIKFPH